jgi:hypothetical protein
VIKALLEFYSCFLKGLESFLGSGDMIRYQINVDGGCGACEKFMRGLFEDIVFP